ncbi:hypothetical protein [Burkholderia sp. WSM2232]|uniref:hypothetical protein n=1 Tax=Burkholderia sp. WSM2232 TaxID=944436 RepID=UPI0003FB6E55|nr:hypothetical protein [Burkholderia sp. WSM2232]
MTTIHESSVYLAGSGQRLAPDDIVETQPSPNGIVQMQDQTGNVLALGGDTQVLLARDGRVALLRGWLKVQHVCTAANCAVPVVETERMRVTPAERSALVIAASTPAYADANANAVFCENGSAQLVTPGKPHGKPAQTGMSVHEFAQLSKTNAGIAVSARLDPAFVAAMPLAFRDALRPLPLPPAPAAPTTPRLATASAPASRPVTYADVSDWLHSALAVRTEPGTRFTQRFGARLSDPAFRRDIRRNLRDLPDWRPLLLPPVKPSMKPLMKPLADPLTPPHPAPARWSGIAAPASPSFASVWARP